MAPEIMDHAFLRTRAVDVDDPKFEEEYKRFRKIYGRKGVLPEAILMLLVERQELRREKAARFKREKVEA